MPEKVVRVNETDRYIIAEQELLDRDGNPKKEYRYWIEDKDNREIVGRNMDYSEFEDKLVELSIEDLELLDVDSFPSMN
ncbi:hypothetical protein JCM19047_4443 [Bacillus sp. JCM 19047]|nr:hypothetical protein JCM19047_4443 [Bacillus sp. JCM 19047]